MNAARATGAGGSWSAPPPPPTGPAPPRAPEVRECAWLTADTLDHHGRRRAWERPAGNPGGEASRRAARHDDADVRGLAELGHCAPRHGGTRLLPEELADVALRPAVARNGARVLGPDHEQCVGYSGMRDTGYDHIFAR